MQDGPGSESKIPAQGEVPEACVCQKQWGEGEAGSFHWCSVADVAAGPQGTCVKWAGDQLAK